MADGAGALALEASLTRSALGVASATKVGVALEVGARASTELRGLLGALAAAGANGANFGACAGLAAGAAMLGVGVQQDAIFATESVSLGAATAALGAGLAGAALVVTGAAVIIFGQDVDASGATAGHAIGADALAGFANLPGDAGAICVFFAARRRGAARRQGEQTKTRDENQHPALPGGHKLLDSFSWV